MSMSLADIQQLFSQSLFEGSPVGISRVFVNDQNPPVEKRFSVYRNNVHQSLINALADTYPVIQRLVGEEFFSAAARTFLRQSPPESPVLTLFGSGFCHFLKSFEPARSLPYLADVARLEYAWQMAYHAADEAPISAENFADIAADDLHNCKLRCHGSLRLIDSEYAVGTVWQANQPDQDEPELIGIDSPQWLAVIRPQYEVRICFLDEPSFRFIEQINAGSSLGQAIATVSESAPEWNVSEVLSFVIQQGFFSQITPIQNH